MTDNHIRTLIIAAALFLAVSCGRGASEGEIPAPGLPSIPSRTVSLTDFGGVGDGIFLNTKAFEDAVGELSSKGGGHLTVPQGIWRTGPIELKSHIDLHLEEGAIVVFDPDQDLYPIINTNFEGLDVRRCLSPLNATGATDISVTGKGIFDGSGEHWREVKKRKVSSDQWKAVTARGGVIAEDGSVWYPDEGYMKARLTAGSLNYPDPSLDENEIKTFLRPVMVSFRECERVLIEGCTFQNSPCWNIHPLWCKDLTVRNITVRNPHYSANGDGIDIDACERVLLQDSTFDVGDDAICIKSGKDADGRAHARACKDLLISGCTVYHGHGGFVIGSEMSGGVENILVRDCTFIGTDVGLRFKSARGRGGLVRNIRCERIYMKDIVTYGVVFNLYYAGVAATEMQKGVESQEVPVDETTPEFRDFSFSGIVCNGSRQAVYINGLPELPLKNVEFNDCIFTSDKDIEIHNAEDIRFNNVTVNGNKI